MDSQVADTLTFSCPACDTSLRVPSSLGGVSGPCPQCRVEITAPQPPALDPGQEANAVIPARVPTQQSGPGANRLSNGPTSALQLQGRSMPTHLPPEETGQSIIRSPASRDSDNIHSHASLRSPGIEPVTEGTPLPARPLAAEPRQTPRPDKPSAKRRISLHPISFILIVLLSAGSGVVTMLMVNPLNYSTLPLPVTPALKIPGETEIFRNATSSIQTIPQSGNYPAGRPVIPHSTAPTPVLPPQRTVDAAQPAAVPSLPPATLSSPRPQVAPPAKGVDAARKVLDAFLAADSVAERLKHVQTPDFVAPKMELYYNKHPLKLVVTGTKHDVSSPVPQSNRQFHIFQLTTPQHSSGFPVSVEETKHGCLVDWTSFVQFHDNLLGKFIRIYQPQPDTFHAILERAHYFRSDVPGLGSKFCFRIKPPVPGYEGYAFINHGSPLADLIEQKFKWDKIYFPVVQLQWTRTPDGARYIEIKDILQDNWRAIQ